jgi:hypothetical protein
MMLMHDELVHPLMTRIPAAHAAVRSLDHIVAKRPCIPGSP